MTEDISILPTVFRLMQGETLSLDECDYAFFKEAVKKGILTENRRERTIKAKQHREERYNFSQDRYGLTLLNFVCRYFNDHETSLLMKYWGTMHDCDLSRRDEEPDIPLNEKDENSLILCGKVGYIQDANKGSMLSVQTKVSYTKLNGVFCNELINTVCFIPEKKRKEVETEIGEKANVLIKGFFRSERGKYKFFSDEEVDVIVEEYVNLGYDGILEPENGDENFFTDRSEAVDGKCLNKVILTGKISNIGFGLTRGYPHLTLHIRTKVNGDKNYLEFPVEIWEKHHKNCLKDINIGQSIWIEGYFKHPIFQKYYYCYEPVDATVFAYKYKIISGP